MKTASRVRRAKPDAALVDARETAREALENDVATALIGDGHRVEVDGERLVTHFFPCLMPAYPGWEWYVTLARASRAKAVTVCEIGVLPGEGALLAPEWIPWAQRMDALDRASAEDQAEDQLDGDEEASPEEDSHSSSEDEGPASP